MADNARVGLTIQGRVQGVGFRPFVWRLARELDLTGFVQNTSAGVRVEAQGGRPALLELERRLKSDLPPLARITAIKREELAQNPGESSFVIGSSAGHAGQNLLVSPDIGICADCLADIRDPANFRRAYPFTNCVNCGPRFSITKSLPYDRKSTVMSCFALCERCSEEYSDPSNRRFHAQPIACPECGPVIWHISKEELENGDTNISPVSLENALERAGRDILDGKTVAIKGLGGFQLACDARNPKAVELLRRRKNRPHKALAVMARDIPAALSFCSPDKLCRELLESPEKPIALCPKKAGGLPAAVSPDSPHIGVMLPNTPLHALLFDWLHEHGLPNPALVMTSANPPGEPICLGNREALERLRGQADSWLLHNRDILVRVDDSVVSPHPAAGGSILAIRRARGYTPVPQKLPPSGGKSPCVLGMGGDLKSAFCIARFDDAFTSQYIGDLANPGALNFYKDALAHFERLLECRPELIVHDSHPDFFSTALARELGEKYNAPLIPLQHHAAHAASVLAENGRYGPALALCLDGSGLGEDGCIWGGELVYMDLSRPCWERAGSFAPFPLPGGEKAVLEPWRAAAALDLAAGETLTGRGKAIAEMIAKGINCPLTSSCGRLFDATAAKLGLCEKITYEGQAAMRLMSAAAGNMDEAPVKLPHRSWLLKNGPLPRIDTLGLFSAAAALFRQTGRSGLAAAFFHAALADALAELCAEGAKKYGVRHVGLSGGVMQNFLMIALLNEKLGSAGLIPLWHRELPPGDGGLAFGQAVWGRQHILSL